MILIFSEKELPEIGIPIIEVFSPKTVCINRFRACFDIVLLA